MKFNDKINGLILDVPTYVATMYEGDFDVIKSYKRKDKTEIRIIKSDTRKEFPFIDVPYTDETNKNFIELQQNDFFFLVVCINGREDDIDVLDEIYDSEDDASSSALEILKVYNILK